MLKRLLLSAIVVGVVSGSSFAIDVNISGAIQVFHMMRIKVMYIPISIYKWISIKW